MTPKYLPAMICELSALASHTYQLSGELTADPDHPRVRLVADQLRRDCENMAATLAVLYPPANFGERMAEKKLQQARKSYEKT